MAGPLAAVERFFERLFERPAARLFQARVEPVQIQRALERSMEAERRIQSRKAYAPSSYRVLISNADHAALDLSTSVLKSEFSESLRVYARSRGYTLLARPEVDIEPSSVVQQGDIRVFATPPDVPAASNGNGHDMFSNAIYQQPRGTNEPRPVSEDADLPIGQATAVFAAPVPTTPKAILAIRCPGQPVVRVEVRPGTLRLGRSLDNDVVLVDDRVSRRHGQIGVRHGMLVYTDLSSTNGSFLNSAAVSEIALGPGDVLQLGSSTITIEPGS
jgi:hypothetical protein